MFNAIKELIQTVVNQKDILDNQNFSIDELLIGGYEKHEESKFDDSLYADWRNIPSENWIETLVGQYVTKRVKLSNQDADK